MPSSQFHCAVCWLEQESSSQQSWVQLLTLLLTWCVALGKSLYLCSSVSPFVKEGWSQYSGAGCDASCLESSLKKIFSWKMQYPLSRYQSHLWLAHHVSSIAIHFETSPFGRLSCCPSHVGDAPSLSTFKSLLQTSLCHDADKTLENGQATGVLSPLLMMLVNTVSLSPCTPSSVPIYYLFVSY